MMEASVHGKGTGDLELSDSNKRDAIRNRTVVPSMERCKRSQILFPDTTTTTTTTTSSRSSDSSKNISTSNPTPISRMVTGTSLCQWEDSKRGSFYHHFSGESLPLRLDDQSVSDNERSDGKPKTKLLSSSPSSTSSSCKAGSGWRRNLLYCDKRQIRGCNHVVWRLPKLQYFTICALLFTLLIHNGIPVAQSAKFPDDATTVKQLPGHDLSNHLLHSKHCSHVYPKPHEIVHGAFIEPHHVMRKRSIDQPLRIVLYYDESVHNLDQEKKELINNTVLPEAISYWERALMVRKTERAIVLNRRCPNQQVYYKSGDPHPYCKNECEAKTMCGEVQVPEEHLDVCRVCDDNGTNCRVIPNSTSGPGIADADFVFYVSALQTHRCKHGFTVAYAAHCQQEAALDRPIAGHANLCPKSISTKPQELDTLISTVKHEILHALGFSVSLYAFYRDDEGKPLTPRDSKGKPPLNTEMQARQWSDRVIKKVVRNDWKVREGNITRNMQMIVTPRVVKEVRRHFACQDLEGAELEDQGEEGTALTHWEKRIFENEAMTGTHTQNPVYSRITLALMEDTGWYRANYDMAQHLAWGFRLGCDFAKKSCMEWMSQAKAKGKDPLPYCNRVKAEPLETQCTDDYSSVALCNLVRYPVPLHKEYQNFDRLPNIPEENISFYGGSVTLADFCPYVQEFTWRANSVVIRGSHCFYEENNPEPDKNFALEEYGEGSKCFFHTREMWEERSCSQKRHWQHWGSGCYKYLCDGGLLHIIVNNRTFTCSYPGQEIKIQLLANGWLHRGGIKCPLCDDFCDDCSGASSSYEVRGDFPQDTLECSPAAAVASFPLLPMFVLMPVVVLLASR